ncbi:MAG: hypothetical protein MUF34_17455 [Polyangiaceae bacterium]|jgi:hypothetical protein|nr:hypothetical protein [Polyangiaceae bacterium]
MGILVGFHVEGGDHLILRSFVASLLGVPESSIVPDWIDVPGRGWQFVLKTLDATIRRFYGKCAQFAVIGIDNDGNDDLTHTGAQEAPGHPRHWNHPSLHPTCRFCQLEAAVAKTRSTLTPLPQKPPQTWPVVLAVPVETIEAWLLELQAIVDPRRGLSRAEDRSRRALKGLLSGKPFATKQDVERVALPLIRAASSAHLEELCARSKAFRLFAQQLRQSRAIILGPRDCWGPGDSAAESAG